MIQNYTTYFILSFVVSVVMTYLVRKIALQFQVVDVPTSARKIHSHPIPLLGGVALVVSFFVVMFFARNETLGSLHLLPILGVFFASVIILIGGIIDDKKDISARAQFFIIVVALLVTVSFGVGPEKITNPLGGFLFLPKIVSGIIVFVWLLLITHTTKLLDGLDGLVTGLTAIGAAMIGFFSLLTKYHQPDIALIAFILSGVCVGFLVWNFHPAKIFLGNVGSIWTGFMLGVLAVISGGKIAVTLLVLGAPLIDMLIVVSRRIASGKPPWQGDATHLHFQLLKSGLGHRGTVYLYWATAALFGGLTIFLQSSGKLIALGVLILGTFFLIATVRPRIHRAPS